MKNLYFEFSEEEMSKFYRCIGKNVKKIRQQKGLAQMELGLALGHTGVGTISVSEIYYNKKHFNLEHLYKIAHILEVDICEFFKTTE